MNTEGVALRKSTDWQRGLSSYKNLSVELADHGIGRFSSGLSTKIHQLVDGRGRPVCYDVDDYKGRNVIERGFNDTKQWRGVAGCYDNSPLPIAAGRLASHHTLAERIRRHALDHLLRRVSAKPDNIALTSADNQKTRQ